MRLRIHYQQQFENKAPRLETFQMVLSQTSFPRSRPYNFEWPSTHDARRLRKSQADAKLSVELKLDIQISCESIIN